MPDVLDGLRYIAESPAREHGGFHPEAVKTARAAIEEIEKLRIERDKLKSAIERYIRTTRRMVAPFAQRGKAGLEACSDQHDAAYQDLLAAAGIPPMRREDL